MEEKNACREGVRSVDGKRYDCILVDIDRTLWDFATNSREALSELALERFEGLSPEEFIGVYEKHNAELWSKYDRAEISKEELRVKRFLLPVEELGLRPPSDMTEEDYSLLLSEEYLEKMGLKTGLVPGAIELLSHFRNKGCRIAAVTNGFRETQYGKIERSGMSGYFDAVVVSEEAGFNKQSAGIFKVALELLGGSKDMAVMIGDSMENDIKGAMDFGIDQVYFNPAKEKSEVRPTYEVSSLHEIISLLA